MSARELLKVPPLRVERLTLPQGLAMAAGGRSPFGGLGYGTPDNLAWMPTVNAQVLSEGGPMADVWQASGEIRSGTTGVARWRTDGH